MRGDTSTGLDFLDGHRRSRLYRGIIPTTDNFLDQILRESARGLALSHGTKCQLTPRANRRKQSPGDHSMNDGDNPQLSLGNIITSLPAVRAAKKVNTLSRVHRRLIEPVELAEDGDEPRLSFQHTVFCQAGLPWGTKPRLILAHLNAEAIRQQSPVIEVEASLSAFVNRIRKFDGGREIRAFKDQLSRLSVAVVRLAMTRGERAFQVNAQVVDAFELWPELDERQRVLWPATIQLSLPYFNSLLE